jgi:hypothetical protein
MDTEMPDVSPPSSLTRSDHTPSNTELPASAPTNTDPPTNTELPASAPTNTDPPASDPTNTSPLANPTNSGGAGSTPSSRNIQISTTSTTQLQDQPEAITESQKDPSMTAKDPTGYSDPAATSKAVGKLPEVWKAAPNVDDQASEQSRINEPPVHSGNKTKKLSIHWSKSKMSY